LEKAGNDAHAYRFHRDELPLDPHGTWGQRRVHWCRREQGARGAQCVGAVWVRRVLEYDP